MIRDRLNSLLTRREIAESVETLAQQHEFRTLLNQKQIIQDLGQFSEIFRWIVDLQQNIQAIEAELSGSGSIKASKKLGDNATLCHKIFSAVKRVEADLEKLNLQKADDDGESSPSENDNLVDLVRSKQFECVKAAYIEAYWMFHALVRSYEQAVRKRDQCASSHQTLTSQSQCDVSKPNHDDVDADHQPSRRHSLDEQIHPSDCTRIAIVEENASETLQAVEERHQELHVLERTLVEMRDLFVLFSTLVMEHGSMLNLAETKVQDAAEHVATAAADIKEAHHYYRKVGGRKWFCFDVTCCLLVLLALLVAIAIYLALKKFLF
ncbi:syntaxin-1A-like [Aedes aegypti]|uniref:Uncharacterized protein n=1 Tax=Aedes aegypti TaxID=7159 RepID=A0A6I8U789_AEDAE|nr:syntaxin-1A-like [Aedes aegypti]